MMAALVLTVELLQLQPQSHRATVALEALRRAAPAAHVQVTPTTSYRGGSDLLLLWGPGAPNRFEPMRQHVAGGGHVIALDLSYWQRDHKVRVSIDTAHPQAWVMRREWPSSRVRSDRIVVENRWNPDGPVILANIGEKALVQYGAAVATWEARLTQACRARGCVVVDRPKRGSIVPIDRALKGASLLVTWHSNAAVDAIRLGIPVICQDGAAAAVCPSELPAFDQPQPLAQALRDRFLANLSWFQWGTTPAEALGCWRWLRELLA